VCQTIAKAVQADAATFASASVHIARSSVLADRLRGLATVWEKLHIPPDQRWLSDFDERSRNLASEAAELVARIQKHGLLPELPHISELIVQILKAGPSNSQDAKVQAWAAFAEALEPKGETEAGWDTWNRTGMGGKDLEMQEAGWQAFGVPACEQMCRRFSALCTILAKTIETEASVKSFPAEEDFTGWLKVSQAAILLIKDFPGLSKTIANARVSSAADRRKFRTNGQKGVRRRIDPVSFDAWRLAEIKRDLDAEDRDEPVHGFGLEERRGVHRANGQNDPQIRANRAGLAL
jgi:hypothetical protein